MTILTINQISWYPDVTSPLYDFPVHDPKELAAEVVHYL